MIDMEHKYKVLVAEDEPLILAGLKFYVEEWGYASAIEEAPNGKVALEKCYSFAPDIIRHQNAWYGWAYDASGNKKNRFENKSDLL